MTLRELLDQHNVDLDQEVGTWTVKREPVEGPPTRDYLTFLPGPLLEIHFTVASPLAAYVSRPAA
jgi:hypothetical protein